MGNLNVPHRARSTEPPEGVLRNPMFKCCASADDAMHPQTRPRLEPPSAAQKLQAQRGCLDPRPSCCNHGGRAAPEISRSYMTEAARCCDAHGKSWQRRGRPRSLVKARVVSRNRGSVGKSTRMVVTKSSGPTTGGQHDWTVCAASFVLPHGPLNFPCFLNAPNATRIGVVPRARPTETQRHCGLQTARACNHTSQDSRSCFLAAPGADPPRDAPEARPSSAVG